MAISDMLRSRKGPVGATVTVRVPASSANLGPAFDSVGLALALYDEVEVRFAGRRAVTVTPFGEGADRVPTDETNLVATTIRQGLAAFDPSGELAEQGLHIVCRNEIPHGRGLGSSAAAIVGGLVAAAALAGMTHELPASALMAMANRIEGHPDNVGAAVLGGATVAWLEDGPAEVGMVARAARLQLHPHLTAVVAIPVTRAGTAKARAALPLAVPHVDAAFNVGRSALLVHALTADPNLLLAATADRLHQQYRAEVYPQSLQLVTDLRARGVAAAISGAGPTVVALTAESANAADELAQRITRSAGSGWQVKQLAIAETGAHVLSSRASGE